MSASNPIARHAAGLLIVLLTILFSFGVTSIGFACDGGCFPSAGSETNEDDNPEDPECEKAGKPISIYSGKETHQVLDLEVKGVYPIRMVRKYDSHSRYDSPLGYGWGFTVDKRLFKYSDGSITVRSDCGNRKKYLFTGNAYQPPINTFHRLVENPDGSFTLTKVDGSQEKYDVEGKLAALITPQGNRLELVYDPAGRLPLTGSSPYALDPATPTVVAFDYRLIEIKERLADGSYSGNRVTLSYSGTSGRLMQIASHDGRSVTYTHDTSQSSQNGNLLQADVLGVIYRYAYDDLNAAGEMQDAHNLTRIQKGQDTTPYINTYDAQDRVIRQDYGFDSYTFDYVIPGLHTDVTQITRSFDGSTVLTTLNETHLYDLDGFPVEKRQTLDDGTQYRQVMIRNGNAKLERAEYYETVAGGSETLIRAYDYSYDTSGNRLSKSVVLDSGEVVTTTWTYEQNWMASEDTVSSLTPTRHFRTEYTFFYDGNGNPANIRETKRKLEDGSFLVTSFSYDHNGRLETSTLPDGHMLVNEYTGDYLTKTYHQIDSLESSYLRRQFGYDARGNINRVTDARNHATDRVFDSRNRIIAETNALSEETVLAYDPLQYGGNYLTHIETGNTAADGTGLETRLVYTPQGWLASIERKDESGVWRLYASFDYDSAGNRTSVTEYRGSEGFTTRYAYDALGRQISETDPAGKTTTTRYDAFANPVSITDAKGRETRYQYDDLDRRIRIEQRGVDPAAMTAMTYDALGNLLTVTDAESKTTANEYDLLSRRTKVIQPLGQTVTTFYDSRDRVDYTVNARGHKTEYRYFPWGAVETVRYFDTVAGTVPSRRVVFEYDFNGNITSVSDDNIQAEPVYQYSYDALNRADTTTVGYIVGQSIVQDDNYDRYGNRYQLSLNDGELNETVYAHDKENRLTAINLPGNNVLGLSYYDNSGYIKSMSHANGVSTAYQYAANGLVDSQTTRDSSAGILEQYVYGYDEVDNIASISSQLDGGAYSYDYDGLDHLTQVIPPAASGLAQEDYRYDRVGNRQDPADSNLYQYDDNHRIQQSPLTSPTPLTYSFDEDGNLSSRSDGTTYTHNRENRLIGYSDGSKTASYLYDPFGRRIRKTVNGVSTWYVWDQTMLLAEYDDNGDRTRLYGYVNGRSGIVEGQMVSMQVSENSITNDYTVHNDHLGTPKYITNSAGKIVWSQRQAAFGIVNTNIDPDGDGTELVFNIRFPGQYYDTESGNHYNYFRDYDPALGRYIQTDPIGLRGGVNTYGYVGANPIRRIDPTGEVFILAVVPFLGGGGGLTLSAGGITKVLLGGTLLAGVLSLSGDTTDTGPSDEAANDDNFCPADDADVDEDDVDPCEDLLAVLIARAIQINTLEKSGVDATIDKIQYSRVRREFCQLCPHLCKRAPSI